MNAATEDEYCQLSRELAAEVARVGAASVVVFGIGNTLRGDDGFGPEVAQRLSDRIPDRVFDAGTVPEDFLGPIVKLKPSLVLIVDAATFNGSPGELRLLRIDQLFGNCLGTHAPSLSLIEQFIACECGAKTMVLAAQPVSVGFGEEQCPEIESAIDRACTILETVLAKAR